MGCLGGTWTNDLCICELLTKSKAIMERVHTCSCVRSEARAAVHCSGAESRLLSLRAADRTKLIEP